MVNYNPKKLREELEAEGLKIHGCSSNGRIDWVSEPTDDEIFKADDVKNKHDPEDREPKKYPYILESPEAIMRTLKYIKAGGIDLGPDADGWIAKMEKVTNDE